MSETEAANPYRELFDKCIDLRIRSVSLQERGRDLCLRSQRLRERNIVFAVINPFRWKQKSHPAFCLPVSLIDTSGI